MSKSSPTTYPLRRRGERMYSSYSFTTSALDGGEWSASRPGHALPPGKDPRYPLYGGWMGPSAGLDTEVTGKILLPLPGINLRSPGRLVRSQTLYWLSYPGSWSRWVTKVISTFIPALTSRLRQDSSWKLGSPPLHSYPVLLNVRHTYCRLANLFERKREF
jgi:hypothetical protein